jgi:hypothetical protein
MCEALDELYGELLGQPSTSGRPLDAVQPDTKAQVLRSA